MTRYYTQTADEAHTG